MTRCGDSVRSRRCSDAVCGRKEKNARSRLKRERRTYATAACAAAFVVMVRSCWPVAAGVAVEAEARAIVEECRATKVWSEELARGRPRVSWRLRRMLIRLGSKQKQSDAAIPHFAGCVFLTRPLNLFLFPRRASRREERESGADKSKTLSVAENHRCVKSA